MTFLTIRLYIMTNLVSSSFFIKFHQVLHPARQELGRVCPTSYQKVNFDTKSTSTLVTTSTRVQLLTGNNFDTRPSSTPCQLRHRWQLRHNTPTSTPFIKDFEILKFHQLNEKFDSKFRLSIYQIVQMRKKCRVLDTSSTFWPLGHICLLQVTL